MLDRKMTVGLVVCGWVLSTTLSWAGVTGVSRGEGPSQTGACALAQQRASNDAARHEQIYTLGNTRRRIRVNIGDCNCSKNDASIGPKWECASLWGLQVD